MQRCNWDALSFRGCAVGGAVKRISTHFNFPQSQKKIQFQYIWNPQQKILIVSVVEFHFPAFAEDSFT